MASKNYTGIRVDGEPEVLIDFFLIHRDACKYEENEAHMDCVCVQCVRAHARERERKERFPVLLSTMAVINAEHRTRLSMTPLYSPSTSLLVQLRSIQHFTMTRSVCR